MLQRENLVLNSRVDGLKLSVLVVEPETGEGVRCVVQLVHGMAEYKERYLPLMEYLAARGCACVIHDHRGHGKSMADPADKGWLNGAGADGLVDDVLLVQEYAAQRFPGLPVVLFGHSMGSLIARCFLREHDDRLQALILSGPPTQNPAAGAGLLLARAQRRIYGPRRKGKLLQAMAFGGYYAKFPESRCAWVCASPETVRAYEDDPLCGFTFKVDGFVGLMELMCRTYERTGWQCAQPELPIVFLGGEDDPCIGGAKKFEQAMAHLRRSGYRNVQGKLYPGMRHEICNERGKQQVFADIAALIEEYL